MNIDFILNNILEHKDSVAVITDEHEYTYGDIYSKYQDVCERLEENHICAGNVVSIIAEYSPTSIAYMIALIERNVIIVPISKSIKNVDSYIRISESEYLIDLRDEEHFDISPTGNTVNHQLLKDLISKGNAGLILFSSGTTGEPKAALHDLSYLMEKFKKPGKVLRTITFLLFDHIGGFNTLFHTIANAGMVITVKTREPEEICRLIEKYDIELLPTSPTFINMLLLSHAYENYDLSSLKIISYGTEPMPESTLKHLHELLPDVRLKQTYGLSEVGIMATRSESSDSLWLKLGGDGFETKIVDDILYIRAKSAMLGYLNAPSPFDEDGWFNTKDKVLMKGEYIKILGRTTDLINVGGEKVYPIEVESVLLEMDGINDVRVYGSSNALTGNIVIAELNVDEQNKNRDFIKAIRRFCKDRLESYKIPTKFIFTENELYGDRLKKKR